MAAVHDKMEVPWTMQEGGAGGSRLLGRHYA